MRLATRWYRRCLDGWVEIPDEAEQLATSAPPSPSRQGVGAALVVLGKRLSALPPSIVALEPPDADALRRLAWIRGQNHAEVIRRALRLEAYLADRLDEGCRLFYEDRRGRFFRIIWPQ